MEPGDVIADRFELVEIAGSGGMGTVYRGRDRTTARPVAVKVLERLTLDHARRFERESWILSELEHPCVVGYIDHGATEGGRPYLAMEWLSGEDLRQRLDRGPLSIKETIAVGRQVASALAQAHRRGVIHRDIKPANLFLQNKDVRQVRVLDFGVARFSAPSVDATQFGVTVGTPSYMSPEQARGEVDLDARADVFSLGCVLFECMTGRPPFAGDSLLAVLAKILLEDVPRLLDIDEHADPRMDDLVALMLEKEPSDRLPDMVTLEAALARLGGPPTDSVPPVARRSPRITRGERRLLSIVATTPTPTAGPASAPFDDETLAGETLPSLSTPASDSLQTTLARFGGRVEALADGSLVAIIEARGEAVDQAAAAARTALALISKVAGVGVAVATGRGIVAGRLPVGDVIDRAARLLPEDPGDPSADMVRIDETTGALLDSRFVIGRDQAGLRLVSERDVGRGVRTLLGRPTPCVGRDMELAILETLHESCITEPRAQAVLVTGAVGLGKSRIRHEFLERLRRRDVDAEVLLARGEPASIRSAFGLLAPAMRRMLGPRDGEPEALARRKIQARVSRHLPEADAARVSQFLGELVSVPFDDRANAALVAARQDPRLMGDQLFSAFIDFLRAECEARPVVIVLEDLHWGDAATIRFIDGALRLLQDQPLFVLALARPQISGQFEQLWESRDVHQIKIKPLTKRASLQLLRATLGDSSDAKTLERLAERAQGNAFFLEELARASTEQEIDSLPDSVLAMVEARLEALEPDARRVLRAASIFGRSFWISAVDALLGHDTPPGRIEELLRSTVERELVSVRRGGRFPGQTEYAFRHAIVREAAYAMLTVGDRTLGHELAGRWLEDAGERDPTILAEHFDEGGDPARAANWFQRAATLALEGNDFERAAEHADRGVNLSVSPDLRGRLLLARTTALSWQGRFAEAKTAALTAAELLVAGTADWYRCIQFGLAALGRVGDYEGVVRRQGDLISSKPAPGAQGAWAVCLCSAARALFQGGDYELAEALLDRLAAAAERPGELGPRAVAEIHRLRGARARHVGDVANDLRWYEACLHAFEQACDTRLACNARVSVAFAYIEVGEFESAERALMQALEEAGRLGLSTVTTRARQNLGLLRASSGRLDEAHALLREVIDQSVERGDVRFAGWTRIYAANVALGRGDLAHAREEAEAAAAELAVTPPARAGAMAALARIEAADGDAEAALTAATEARKTLEELGGIEEFESLVHVAVIEALLANGQREAATRAAALATDRVSSKAEELEEPRRCSFLQRVPENARIRELMAQLREEPSK